MLFSERPQRVTRVTCTNEPPFYRTYRLPSGSAVRIFDDPARQPIIMWQDRPAERISRTAAARILRNARRIARILNDGYKPDNPPWPRDKHGRMPHGDPLAGMLPKVNPFDGGIPRGFSHRCQPGGQA